MKILITLCSVQTLILLFLLSKTVISEDGSTVGGPVNQNMLPTDDHAIRQSQIMSGNIQLYSAEDRLRQIIREELAARPVHTSTSIEQMHAFSGSGSVNSDENQIKRDIVVQQLEYHKSAGEISNADMQKLQMQIGKLDEVSRREMLRKLTQALNSGELQGRF